MQVESKVIDTSKVIKEVGSIAKKDIYYIPGFLRLKCKNFTAMDLENLNAGMNASIIFTVYYGKLPQQIVPSLMNGIVLLFGRDNAKQLTENKDDLEVSCKNKKEDYEIQFTVRQVFQLRIQSDVFWTPFELINLILAITVQPVVTEFGTVKVNLMNHKERIFKSSYSEEGAFGTYDLAPRLMRTEYSNQRAIDVEDFYKSEDERKAEYDQLLAKIKPKDKLEQFQYANFLIPLYKYPLVSLATIFLPLWLLAIINLGIFYQNTSMGDRVGSIAGIAIAFVALIPTIRDNIPPNPRIVFIQILVYLATLTSIFVLIDSVSIRNDGDEYQFDWSVNGLFIVSCIITIFTVVVIFVLMIFHYVKWEPSYRINIKDELEVKFKREQWKSEFCNAYFTKMDLIAKDKIKLEVLDDPVKENKKKDDKKDDKKDEKKMSMKAQ